jgi:LPPG:FO 2-phospho-L-lactate transferase
MVTFLSGGTGTPKLLWGADAVFDNAEITVLANTGDDVELGGLFVCPDVDTVLFLGGDELDRETWWGIADDTAATHEELQSLASAAGLGTGTGYLDDTAQTSGRHLSRWRRFSGVGEFMYIGDRDRAIHITRTSLLEEGHSLTETIDILADALGVPWTVLPMSDDPVASIIHTPDGPMHFQEFWVAHDGEPAVERVEFRGSAGAQPTEPVLESLSDPVVIGPSNPITSLGPILALDGVPATLETTPVVAVSPFVEDRLFSGPAAQLMRAHGHEASTAGIAEAYPFVDAFVLDDTDGTDLDRPVVRTDTTIDDSTDSSRVVRAIETAFESIGATEDLP